MCASSSNLEGCFYAIDDTCTHRGRPLSEGEVSGEEVTWCTCAVRAVPRGGRWRPSGSVTKNECLLRDHLLAVHRCSRRPGAGCSGHFVVTEGRPPAA
ncbi:MAG: Rieske 2Fe-2S domain-containing protein [Deltaproteobacteria bacterium]|nr:MAG: Rieske 2Fe-2S domain-containing protein [Deltaproteobacteria bacterium]